MNGVIDYVKKWRQDNAWKRRQDDAQSEFDKQVRAIKDIRHTPGYAAIVQFFSETEAAAIDRSLGEEGAQGFRAREEARLCRKFLGFLKHRELAEIPEEGTTEL